MKTGVENGKIVIKTDSVVAKKGEVISAELAGILTRLGIEPMDIGLGLKVAFENGQFYDAEILNIDIDQYKENIQTAHSNSMNLAVHVSYPNSETLPLLISKAYANSISLAVESLFITKETINLIFSKCQNQAFGLISKLPSEVIPKELNMNVEENVNTSVSSTNENDADKKTAEKKEDNVEENVAAGLGDLFG